MGFHHGKENARFVILCSRERKEMIALKSNPFCIASEHNVTSIMELRIST